MSSTPRNLAALAAALLLVAAIAGGWRLWRLTQAVEARISRTEQRAEAARVRLQEAERRASAARREIEAAEARTRRARERTGRALSLREEAALGRMSADERAELARQKAEEAWHAAEKAARRAERERLRRNEEWGRLERALGSIGKVKRDGRALNVELSKPGRETFSKLAGALLASYGYRVMVAGAGAARLTGYLREAGVPQDAFRPSGASSGALRIRVEDTILSAASE